HASAVTLAASARAAHIRNAATRVTRTYQHFIKTGWKRYFHLVALHPWRPSTVTRQTADVTCFSAVPRAGAAVAKEVPMRLLTTLSILIASGCGSRVSNDPEDGQAILGAVALSATAPSASEVDLSWTSSQSGVTQIIVKRGTSSGSLASLATLGGSASSFQD